MLLIVGTIRLPPGGVSAAQAAMAAMITASREEDGCIEYAYALDVLDPGLIRVTEQWRDQAALDRHFASTHIAAWRATWGALGITDRDLRRFDAGSSSPT